MGGKAIKLYTYSVIFVGFKYATCWTGDILAGIKFSHIVNELCHLELAAWFRKQNSVICIAISTCS